MPKSLAISATLYLVSSIAPWAGADDGWSQLGFERRPIEGATLYLDPKLNADAQAITKSLEEFLVERRRVESQFEGLVDRVEVRLREVLGIELSDDKRAEVLGKGLESFRSLARNSLATPDRLRFYVFASPTTREYLRKGGMLENIVYDPATDRAAVQIKLGSMFNETEGSRDSKPVEVIPLPVGETVGETPVVQVRNSLLVYGLMGNPTMILHEAVEGTLLASIPPFVDPCIRWFSDGFATAIAVHVLRELGMEDQARQAMGMWGAVESFDDIKRDVNLRWWLNMSFAVPDAMRRPSSTDPPASESIFSREDRLSNARYLFSALEAQRLIDAHGIGCVRAILDKVRAYPRLTSANLVRAVSDATGEDIEQRLKAYQPYATREEGDALHSQAYLDARQRGEKDAALYHLLRLMEVRMATGDASMMFYKQATDLLVDLGHTPVAIRVLEVTAMEFERLNKPKVPDVLRRWARELQR